MTLETFYEHVLAFTPEAGEEMLHALLTNALAVVSAECGVPRLRIAVTPDAGGRAAAAVSGRLRQVLTLPLAAGPRATVAVVHEHDGDVLVFENVQAPFAVDAELLPPDVPRSDEAAAFSAFEVPFADVCLSYVLSELATQRAETAGHPHPTTARMYYSRFEQGKLRLKHMARRGFDGGPGILSVSLHT